MDPETLDEVRLAVSYLLDAQANVTGEMLDTYLAMRKVLDSGPPRVSSRINAGIELALREIELESLVAACRARIYARVMNRLSAMEARYKWLIFDLENNVLLTAA